MGKRHEREQFQASVFARDNGKCVVCHAPAVDAHHILERRLWPDGGYVLDNGVSVCETCHIMAEQTVISPQELRDLAGIKTVLLPPHLYPSEEYDKWGNIMMSDGSRIRGELFSDGSVQKVLSDGGVLSLFSNTVKYPRTYHLPWSLGKTSDDRTMENTSGFTGREVVVSEKRDGENFSMYNHGTHARSITSESHSSRNMVKSMWARIAHEIPHGWRVCGENLYARHSIAYDDLTSYFAGFSIWDDRNVCLSWDDTLTYFDLLGIEPVPVLYRGVYDEKVIRAIGDAQLDLTKQEGYVIRIADEFIYGQFRNCVGKFVRANHVTSDAHWKFKQIVPNKLKGSKL